MEKEELEVIVEYGEKKEPFGKPYKYERMKNNGTIIVTFKITRELLERFDNCWKRKGVMHRSEAIRDAIIRYLESEGCA